VLVAALFAASLRWDFWFLHWTGWVRGIVARGLSFSSGGVTALQIPAPDLSPQDSWEFGCTRTANRPFRWWVYWEEVKGSITFVLPLWIPFALFAVPTLILFHHDRPSARRKRAGQCAKCGYDRAGLAVGAVCPECGGA
jgi:hypothetical protein